MAPLMTSPWSVTITAGHWEQLYAHLFPGDVDEHAAVLRCGIAKSARGTRLLVRDVVIAADGIDYIPGDRGYRKLTTRVRSAGLGLVRRGGACLPCGALPRWCR